MAGFCQTDRAPLASRNCGCGELFIRATASACHPAVLAQHACTVLRMRFGSASWLRNFLHICFVKGCERRQRSSATRKHVTMEEHASLATSAASAAAAGSSGRRERSCCAGAANYKLGPVVREEQRLSGGGMLAAAPLRTREGGKGRSWMQQRGGLVAPPTPRSARSRRGTANLLSQRVRLSELC